MPPVACARRALAATTVAIGIAAMGCSHAAPRLPSGEAVVREVVDGDTIEVDIDGRREAVRLLGIDTPETHHPTKPVGCFGPEAAAQTAALLPAGTAVQLVRDVEPRDQYGRLLAYVFRRDDGLFVNASLVTDGFADVLVIEPNGAYAGELRSARAEAARDARGLWGACPT